VNSCITGCFSCQPLQVILGPVVSAQGFAGRVKTQANGREEIMPSILKGRMGILAGKSIRQPKIRTTSEHQILREKIFYSLCLLQYRYDLIGQRL